MFRIHDPDVEVDLQSVAESCSTDPKKAAMLVPQVENEKWPLLRTEYGQGLARCKYGKVVDQHYLIWSLAWGIFNALVMVLDAMSDLYLCMQLFVEPLFVPVEIQLKVVYSVLVMTGISVWLGVAVYQTRTYGAYYLHDSLQNHPWVDRQIYHFSLFLCYLCNMPSYLLVLGRRLVKIASVPDGPHHNFYMLLAYNSHNDWEHRMQYGLLSHVPIFLIKDLPAVGFNIFFIVRLQVYTNPVIIVSLSMSTIAAMIKGYELERWWRARVRMVRSEQVAEDQRRFSLQTPTEKMPSGRPRKLSLTKMASFTLAKWRRLHKNKAGSAPSSFALKDGAPPAPIRRNVTDSFVIAKERESKRSSITGIAASMNPSEVLGGVVDPTKSMKRNYTKMGSVRMLELNQQRAAVAKLAAEKNAEAREGEAKPESPGSKIRRPHSPLALNLTPPSRPRPLGS